MCCHDAMVLILSMCSLLIVNCTFCCVASVTGDVDISGACAGSFQGLETGKAIVNVEVRLSQALSDITETVLTNNMYQQTVDVNCNQGIL